MVERRSFPTSDPQREACITTERMNDGTWAVVAAVTHHSETATKNIDLPVIDKRFGTQADAQDFGLRMALNWVDQNSPS